MNDPTLSQLAEKQRSLEMGTKFWDIAQKVIGWALVAGIVWLIDDRNTAWDSIDTTAHDLEFHAVEGKRRHALLDREIRQINDDIDDLSDAVRECQLQAQRTLIQMAELPPDKWEAKIEKNAHDIAVMRSQNAAD